MRRGRLVVVAALLLLLTPALLTTAQTTTGRTSVSLCRGCHGGRFTDYVTVSQFTVPVEVAGDEVIQVSARYDISGNVDARTERYWYVDLEVRLESVHGLVTIEEATRTWTRLLPGMGEVLTWNVTGGLVEGTDVLQVVASGRAEHEGRRGSDSLAADLDVTSAGERPTLGAAAVAPAFGAPGTTFAYNVTWTDVDGDLPDGVEVHIGALTFPMSAVDPLDVDATDGITYQAAGIELPVGAHTHRFSGHVGSTQVALPLGVGAAPLDGPVVADPPVLDGAAATVEPPVGDATTTFEFGILLDDPAVFAAPNVTLVVDGVEYPAVLTSLNATSSMANVSLDLAAGVVHHHHWEVTTAFGTHRWPATGEVDGPIVLGDVLANASVSPVAGDDRVERVFDVLWSHPVVTFPDTLDLVIDGTPIAVTPASIVTTSQSEGTAIRTTGTLSAGTHGYHWLATVGADTWRLPEVGDVSLHVTRHDSPPVIEIIELPDTNATLRVGTAMTFEVRYTDAEDDEARLALEIDGVTLPMRLIEPERSPSEGQRWESVLTIGVGSNRTLRIVADAGPWAGASWPAEGVATLPDVLPPNQAPRLTPAADAPLVDPPTGAVGSPSVFTVVVHDPDGANGGRDQVAVVVDGIAHPMQRVGPAADGTGWRWNVTLTLNASLHAFHFTATDADGGEGRYPPAHQGEIDGPVLQQGLNVGSIQLPFQSQGWWFVGLDLVLIVAGLGWAALTFVRGKRTANQRRDRRAAHRARRDEAELWEESERSPVVAEADDSS